MNKEVLTYRKNYNISTIDEDNLQEDPFKQFEAWLNYAYEEKYPEPNAFVLSTANAEACPSSRVLLLKEFSPKGFLFYTNFNSRKAQQIVENPHVAMNFFWYPIEKQICIEGEALMLSSEESDQYFSTRPRESQIGAWASPQSKVLAKRSELENRLAEVRKTYPATAQVPRPPHWGGYIVKPHYFEFWQGRSDRLHDRMVYIADDGKWIIKRLAP